MSDDHSRSVVADLCADQRRRWSAGETVRVEAYLATHPELTSDPNALLDLIYNEVILREQRGEGATAEEYVARFPALAAPIHDQFAVHQAIVASEAPTGVLTHVDSTIHGKGATLNTHVPPMLPDPAPGSSRESGEVPGTARRGADHPLPVQVGRFEVRGYLGGGAFGQVYRAFDPTLRREVAIKLPRPDRVQAAIDRVRFLNEARAAAGIRHPHVVPVYEVGEADGTPFIVMGYVPGPTLAAVLADRPTPFRPGEAAIIVRSLALAVQAAHDRGVIHRDLKPGNVLLDAERAEFVVTDFGLARLSEPTDARGSGRGITGTPAYAPPEQVRGDSTAVGPRSDVYSLGAILFELLTRQLPFPGTSAADVMALALTAPPPSPSERSPGIPAALDVVCRKAMAKDPTSRYASAQQLADALAPFTDSIAPVLPPTGRPGTPPSDPGKHTTQLHEPASAVHHTPGGERTRRRRAIGGVILLAMAITAAVIHASRNTHDNGDLNAITDGNRNSPATVDGVADRRAAEWVLLSGGKLEVIERGTQTKREPTTLAELPSGFRVSRITLSNPEAVIDEAIAANLSGLSGPIEINLGECPRLTNVGFAVVARLPGLTRLDLKYAPQVTDQGAKALAGSSCLNTAYLCDTGMTAAGIADVARIPGLEVLSFHGHKITDDFLAAAGQALSLQHLYAGYSKPGGRLTAAGFPHLVGLKHLYLLDLDSANVERGALRSLPALSALTQLYLKDTGAGDGELPILSRYPHLQTLGLHDLPVTDASMAELAKCPALQNLILDGTQVGDPGLALLEECKSLRRLSLKGTPTTAAGVAKFQKALPDCKIENPTER